MAAKQFYHDIDLVNVGQILNTRLHNVADDTALGAVASPGTGQLVYQVDEKLIKIYDGTAWVPLSPELEGDIVFAGSVDASTSLDGQVTEKAGTGGYKGLQYVVGTAGTLSMTGFTFTPNTSVGVGDMVLFTSDTTATVIQRDLDEATTDEAGYVELATDGETNTGTDGTLAVTPKGLQYKLDNQSYVKQYTATVNTVANTGLNVNHGLNLQDRNAFTVNLMHNNTQIAATIASVDTDNIEITTTSSLTGIYVVVMGASTTPA